MHRPLLALSVCACGAAPAPLIPAPPRPVAGAPLEIVEAPPPPRPEDLPPMPEEDGTSPRQQAMFAPEEPAQPWSELRDWLHDRGVIGVATDDDLASVIGQAPSTVGCVRIVRLPRRTEALLCTRAYLVEPWISATDWVLFDVRGGVLHTLWRGPASVGANDFMKPSQLGPYTRFTIAFEPSGAGFTLDEAAAGVCGDARERALRLRSRAARAAVDAHLARTCAALGRHVWTRDGFVREP